MDPGSVFDPSELTHVGRSWTLLDLPLIMTLLLFSSLLLFSFELLIVVVLLPLLAVLPLLVLSFVACMTAFNGAAIPFNVRSNSSSLPRILKLAGSKLDKSTEDWMHVAPTLVQLEQDGKLLSHFVLRARQGWQAVLERFRA
jgi:hypothetical protein